MFIHFDSKWNISGEEIEHFCGQFRNVYAVKKRLSGVLDTWSLVEISMLLVHRAFEIEEKKKQEYGYFYLMSGQDYPIKSSQYIAEYLDSVYPKPLIDCTPEVSDNWIHSTFKRIRYVNLYNKINRVSDNKTIQKICKIPLYAYQEVLTLVVGSPYKHLKEQNVELYGGSAWWALPRDCIKYIDDQYKKNTEQIKWHKKSTTPEETFFQTVVMHSPMSSKIELNDPYETKQNCMTYAYFQDEGKPAIGHPYAFTRDEIGKLSSLPHLFARKFDMDVDSEIFDLVDSCCRGIK